MKLLAAAVGGWVAFVAYVAVFLWVAGHPL